MDPWKSWAIVGVVGAGAAYYYSQSGKSKRGRDRKFSLQAEQGQRHTSDTRNDSKDNRKKNGKAKASDASHRAASDVAEASSASTGPTSTDKVKNRKGGKKQNSKLAKSSAVDVSKHREVDLEDVDGADEEISNKEFAKQLSGLKTGTPLNKPLAAGKEDKKGRKQGRSKELQPDAANGAPPKPNGLPKPQDFSTASSTTGADADDDLSLPVSPDLGATQATTASGGDVSDMLEAPAKGPSVLRITQPANSQPAKEPKPKKVTPEPETKKQRQNRQKNEEKKALREQAEKERRVLLEKQLRTAREAEGRPAKNGVPVSKAPSTSAWAASPAGTPANSGTQAARSETGTLLDTFDEDKSFLGQPLAHIDGGVHSAAADKEKAWNRDLPSEEEQLRLINEIDGDGTWNTVGKGGKGKKNFTKDMPAGKSTVAADSKNIPGNSTQLSSNNVNNTPLNNYSSSTNGKTTSESDNLSTSMSSTHSEDLTASDTAMSSALDKTNTSSKITASEGSKHEVGDNNDHEDEPEDLGDEKRSSYGGSVPLAVSKRWRAIAKNLDRNVWNYNNIQDHPDYDPDWPYALTGHPMDSDWAGDWDSDDMRKANENRAKEADASKAAGKPERVAQKGKE